MTKHNVLEAKGFIDALHTGVRQTGAHGEAASICWDSKTIWNMPQRRPASRRNDEGSAGSPSPIISSSSWTRPTHQPNDDSKWEMNPLADLPSVQEHGEKTFKMSWLSSTKSDSSTSTDASSKTISEPQRKGKGKRRTICRDPDKCSITTQQIYKTTGNLPHNPTCTFSATASPCPHESNQIRKLGQNTRDVQTCDVIRWNELI